ncbi:MAG TPA: PPC domain-containing protein, partial [Candidatus Thermoplasmatota archaeon]|nr:PPC domain-containing protein [Candidatus Thermoplasmatota archaeon]
MGALVLAALLTLPAALMGIAAAASPAPASTPGGCPAAGSEGALTLDGAVVGTAASTAATDDCFYLLQLSGDFTGKRLRFALTSTENHDLYVGRGVTPTSTASTCSGLGNGRAASETAETCIVDWPVFEGAYLVRVHRVTAGAGEFTLTATLDTVADPGCTNGFNLVDLGTNVNSAAFRVGLAAGSKCVFRYAAPAGADVVKASSTSAWSNTLTLSLRSDYAPSSTDNHCTVTGNGLIAISCSKTGVATDTVWYLSATRITAASSTSDIAVRATVGGCALGRGIHALSLDSTLAASLYPEAGSACYFSVPSDEGKSLSKVTMTPSGANFDLRLRKGALPTTSASDCASTVTTSGATETCTLRWLGANGVFAMVNRPSAAATGVAGHTFTVQATAAEGCSPGGVTPVVLDDDVAATGSLTGDVDAACFFRLDPDPEAALVRVSLAPAAGNFDLYVKKGSAPTGTTGNDCASVVTGTSVDTCEVQNDGSPVFAMVRRTSGSGAFTVRALTLSPCSLGSGDVALASGVEVLGALTEDEGGACNFVLDLGDTEDTLLATLAPETGNFDLYVRKGSRPTATTYDCRSNAANASTETCRLVLGSGRYHLRVVRASGSGDFSLTANAVSACSHGVAPQPLVAGTPAEASLLDVSGAACVFYVDVPADADTLTATLTPPPAGANFDLYVRKGSVPTTSTYDCRSQAAGAGVDTCLVSLDAGRYFVRVHRVSGEGAFTLVADSLASCVSGATVRTLQAGVPASSALLDLPGAKCYYAFTPGDPLADPLNPGNDVAAFSLLPESGSFDLYVRKGALPTTSTYTCRSVLTGTANDRCETMVADGSTYYVMVRRTSGSGAFTVTATTSSTCSLGSGIHPLPNGVEVTGAVRSLAGSKCYFSLPSKAKDDLVTFVQQAATMNSQFTLTVAKGYLPGTGPATCSASSYWYYVFGLTLEQLAQCDILLEDAVPLTWYVSVARAAGTDPEFRLTGTAMEIPTLLSGVPMNGHVDVGTTQYWKVVLPEGATSLTIQTAGDPTNLACAAGGAANPTVNTACLLLPFPTLVGCALAAGQGVSCDQAEQTVQARCVTATADAATCATLEQARVDGCAAVDGASPGACAPGDTTGSLTATCRFVNKATADSKCDPYGANAKTTELDMLVRFGGGLPKSNAYTCRSAEAGATERCVFDGRVKDARDNTTEPARGNANRNLTAAWKSVDENRTAADNGLALVKRMVRENRTATVEPLWAQVRA